MSDRVKAGLRVAIPRLALLALLALSVLFSISYARSFRHEDVMPTELTGTYQSLSRILALAGVVMPIVLMIRSPRQMAIDLLLLLLAVPVLFLSFVCS
jgi:hypothetical protein